MVVMTAPLKHHDKRWISRTGDQRSEMWRAPCPHVPRTREADREAPGMDGRLKRTPIARSSSGCTVQARPHSECHNSKADVIRSHEMRNIGVSESPEGCAPEKTDHRRAVNVNSLCQCSTQS